MTGFGMMSFRTVVIVIHKMLSSLHYNLQTESRQMEYQMKEIDFRISQAWAEGGINVGDPMLNIEKCCEGVRAPTTAEKSENFVHSTFHVS